jgi:cytochrome c oxidase assembly factor CtaG
MQWWCSAQGEPWTWAWQAYPGVWLFIGLLAFGYVRLLRSLPHEERASRLQVGCFTAGAVLLWLALDWPIGALGAGYLASVHMIQFLVLGMVVPPLLLCSLPRAALDRLPGTVQRGLRLVTRPVRAFLLFNLMVVATHLPDVVDALMATQLGSFAIDVAWIGGGLIFWWPVVHGASASQLGELAKVGYLGLQLIAMKPLFVFLTFSKYPKYATYELAPRVHHITARGDQQTAGLLMEVAGMIIILVAVGVIFRTWGAREDRDMRGQLQPSGAQLEPSGGASGAMAASPAAPATQ